MDQLAHDSRPVTDHRRIANEPSDTRVRADRDAITDIGAVDDPGPVADHTPISDPCPVFYDAIGAEQSAFVDDNLVEQQNPVSEHDRSARRTPLTLGFSDTHFFRISENTVLADCDVITEPNRPV
ncbi:hypothetical protein [Nocardia gipuzkoensis]|uniref:hypothetical protein n=1 Tax=Nocardia gipuzkoensis TaxID=2749991 RepID=UPI0030B84AF8